jgi:hypothetical protein
MLINSIVSVLVLVSGVCFRDLILNNLIYAIWERQILGAELMPKTWRIYLQIVVYTNITKT